MSNKKVSSEAVGRDSKHSKGTKVMIQTFPIWWLAGCNFN